MSSRVRDGGGGGRPLLGEARLVPALMAAAALAVLGAAWYYQYVAGLEPCKLCLWQRYPYYAAIALGVLGVVVAGRTPLRRACVGLGGLAFLATAGIAGFHVGVEQGWWEGLPGCSVAAIEKDMTIEELRAVLEARERVVPCDEPAWTLLGISMAGYNLLLGLGLAAATGWALVTRRA